MVRKTTGIPSVVFGQQQAQQPRYGLGSLLGETLGGFAGGLGTGIQALAQSKLQQMQQRQLQEQQAPIFKSLGLDPNIGLLEPSVQREIIKRKLLEPQEQAYSSLISSIMDGQPESADAQVSPDAEGFREGAVIPETQGTPTLRTTGLSGQQATNIANLTMKKDKLNLEKDLAIKKDFDEAVKVKKMSDERLDNLKGMLSLSKSGKLDSPIMAKALTDFGLDFLLAPESQEYLAREKDFLSDLKSIFGGRMNEFEVRSFLKSVPRLVNSPEGRERIINMLNYKFKANSARSQIMMDIIKNNRRIGPLDLSLQVEERLQQKLDKLSQKMNFSMREGGLFKDKQGNTYRIVKGKPVLETKTGV